MDCIIHGVTKSRTRVSDFHFTFLPARHRRGLPWWLSGKESGCNEGDRFDPRVGKIPWRIEWQPTLVFLPGESHGQKSLAGYSPWNSPGQNTGVGSLSLLQGIFPTQGSIPGLPHCRQISYQPSPQGSPAGRKALQMPLPRRAADLNVEGVEGGGRGGRGRKKESLRTLLKIPGTLSFGPVRSFGLVILGQEVI